ncbi:MAG: hypothetical protein E6Q67_03250 [Roseateles sp.]|nr:MAG: hypothetical protein E6Q67_03250 [Roseateles sp.]
METDLFAGTTFGRAALKKMAPLPENFRLYCAEWLGEKPEDWKEMRVTGRVFRASKGGKLDSAAYRETKLQVERWNQAWSSNR